MKELPEEARKKNDRVPEDVDQVRFFEGIPFFRHTAQCSSSGPSRFLHLVADFSPQQRQMKDV